MLYDDVKNLNMKFTLDNLHSIYEYGKAHKAIISTSIDNAQHDLKSYFASYIGDSPAASLKWTPSSFFISKRDSLYINSLASSLFIVIEKVIDAIYMGDKKLLSYFSNHKDFIPIIKKQTKTSI